MRNLILVLALVVSVSSSVVSAGECVGGTCSLRSRAVTVTREIVSVPVQVTRRTVEVTRNVGRRTLSRVRNIVR